MGGVQVGLDEFRDNVGVGHLLYFFIAFDELNDFGERVGIGIFRFEGQDDGGVDGVVGIFFEVVAEEFLGDFDIFGAGGEAGGGDEGLAFEGEFIVADVGFWDGLVDGGDHGGGIDGAGGLLWGSGEEQHFKFEVLGDVPQILGREKGQNCDEPHEKHGECYAANGS